MPSTTISAAGVTPTGKIEPDGGAKLTDATPAQPPLTVGVGKIATPLLWPCATETIKFGEKLLTLGPAVSCTRTVVDTELEMPWLSTTV